MFVLRMPGTNSGSRAFTHGLLLQVSHLAVEMALKLT